MGLSLSLLLSAWKEILKHQVFGYADTEKVIVRSISLGREDIKVTLKAKSFNKDDSESPINKFDSLNNGGDFKEPKLETSDSFKQIAFDQGNGNSVVSNDKANRIVIRTKPTIKLPEPAVLFSPRPVTELDTAATKLQKVYKGHRTRRNLADCAVVVEELWWKTLDSAALRRCSISFYDIEKQETVMSKWARAKTRAAKVGKGLSKDENAQQLALQHWLEAIDPRHRYGHNLHFYYDVWSASKSTQPFFYWLDIGDGKELNLKKCQRIDLQQQCIKYLGPKKREAFEVIVESGKLVYKQSGMLVNTLEGSKWIFVLSTSRSLYVGQKKKGVFQHSSFLSGGATTAAGRLVASQGVLEAIWPYSGHYLPTEDNFKEFIIFLEEHNVDLTNVKRCAIDDDYTSYKSANDESKHGEVKDPTATTNSTDSMAVDVDGPTNGACMIIESLQSSMGTSAANVEAPAFNKAKRLSCKWTSGVGPRIGCIRDYPTELQSQALEQVNLSPRVTPGRFGNSGPIPSPRPSPKIRVSPRLAYMGLPSPRVSVVANKTF
ncbi:IQ domain-containing protein IQM1-like isoform X2 [Durio zibethinus]|nr:IQ domain-containing protein IQM1-like isoform X2 [Durio zibethinus]